MRKATTLLLLLLAPLYIIMTSARMPPHQTYRTDILIPGTQANPKGYYAFPGEDFMSKWGLLPGDTVAVKVGPNGENYMDNIDLSNATLNGITFMNDPSNTKQIVCGWFGMGGMCMNVRLLGNGSKSVYYGFKFISPMNFGLSWQCVGNVEAGFIQVDGALMGVSIITAKGHTYATDFQTVYLHNIRVSHVIDEAFYLGYAGEPAILMRLRIDSCTVRYSGRDGLQTRCTISTELTNNDMDSIGMKGDYGHDHSILLANNKEGAIIRNNKARNVHGLGIFNCGWGNFLFECNDIQNQSYGVMTRCLAYDNGIYTDPQEIGFQKQTFKNNTFTSGAGLTTFEIYYENNGKAVSVDAENNKINGGIHVYVPDFININNGANTVPQCVPNPVPIPVPLPVQLESFTAVKKGRAVLVQWKASESAFDHYELQKSTNGVTYSLNARVAGGQTNYQVYDYFPSETNYYRLKMIDSDGSYTFSKVVVVNMSKSNKVHSIYNLAGADMGTDVGKLKKGFYVVVYEDGGKEYLVK